MADLGRGNLAVETTTTTGTGNVTLAGAYANYRTFANAGVSNGEDVWYVIKNARTLEDATEWEVGCNTYNSAGPTITRDADANVVASSNSNNRVNFSAGTKYVELTNPIEMVGPPLVQATTPSLPFQGQLWLDSSATDTDDAMQWADKSASFNAAVGYHYLVDIATAAADVTVTLPSSASQGDKIRITVEDDDLTNGYAVKFDLNGLKLHSGTDDDPWWLFIEGDTLEITYSGDATLGWIVTDDGIQPHRVNMTRDAAQSIANASWTKVLLDAETFDYGGIGDYAVNNRVNIRRDGEYLVSIYYSAAVDSTEFISCAVYVDGVLRKAVFDVSSATLTLSATRAESILLSAGQYLELWVYQNQGAAQNTVTTIHNKPQISVTEIRPR